ncbi:MAG TPA: mannitol dehydrogenase family protein [Paracoccaceae bacterium]|nr:mannitol dehydrogenase family protein [Paracoccaceae bacterium]HMO71160.1 mannitol dehydrogenase family protein [Paracoccaceae bacterium]
MTMLSDATLGALPPGVDPPGYDRAGLTPGIVHVGCGNFHRAHMAVYLDDLMRQGLARGWAILGAGVRAGDAAMRAALAPQDWMFTVIEMAPGRHSARTIGAMTGFVPVEEGNAALIAAMADPGIRIVSLTVTEGGYFTDPDTGTFSPDHDDIRHDAAHPDAPRTVFGAIVAALARRRAADVAPFTVMCCDNLPHNGTVTRDAVTGLARLSDPGLAGWIAANVAFPNSMVDRITPATGPRERAIAAAFGVSDAAPVTCEDFRQWVMEDNFPQGRPPFEAAGVTFTDRVDAFEAMKIRILNGGHAIIAYPSGLAGVEHVHEAMADARLCGFLDAVLTREVVPGVAPVPGVDLMDYKALILRRFANPEVADTIRRLCLDGSNRQPKFIVPSLRDALAARRPAQGLILLSALWCRYCAGSDEAGRVIAPNDPDWAALNERAQAARHDPAAWLSMAKVYGDTGRDPEFAGPFAHALAQIWSEGSAAVIDRYLAAGP